MEDTITIDTDIFQEALKLIYMFVPTGELERLENMLDKRNTALKSFLYEKSISQ